MKTLGCTPLVLGLALLAAGCGAPTQEARDNRRLVDAILTAITLKNARLLDDTGKGARKARAEAKPADQGKEGLAAQVEKRHETGQFTDEQYEELREILRKAKLGDWEGAEKNAYEFRKRFPFVKEGQ